MKNRILWLALTVAVIAAAYFIARRPTPPAPGGTADRTPPASQTRSVAPGPVYATPAPVATQTAPGRPMTTATPVAPRVQRKTESPKPVVPIQDGATIDFSIGAPVVRSGGTDTEALERSLKEMATATKDVTFPPPAKPAPEPAPKK